MDEKTASQQPGPEIDDQSGAELVKREYSSSPDSGSLAEVNASQNTPCDLNLDCVSHECMVTKKITEEKETHGRQIGPDDGHCRAPGRGNCAKSDGVTGKGK